MTRHKDLRLRTGACFAGSRILNEFGHTWQKNTQASFSTPQHMAAVPIPAHLVHTVFQYIFPPSLPLPRHLLSRPLIERHHFLGVPPTDPASYLSWPSPHTAQVAAALEFTFPEALTSQPVHDVRYSAPDQETLLAHVRPHSMSPLQIVFAWDVGTESWRYHDARMLPFPDNSLSSLEAALVQRPNNISNLGLSPNEFDEVPRKTRSSSPASDNYWAGYDSSGSSPTTSAPVNVMTEDDEKAEAAYWASYGGVHGSGDSTVPSPSRDKDHVPQTQQQGDLRGPDIVVDPFIAHLHLRLHEQDERLNQRLHSPPEHPDHQLSVTMRDPKPVESPAMVGKHEEYGNRDSQLHHPDTDTARVDELLHPGQSKNRREADEGVKDAVRGIYRMWKAHTSSEDVGDFMEVVRSALETS